MGHSTEAPESHREPHNVCVCVNADVCACERVVSVFYQ